MKNTIIKISVAWAIAFAISFSAEADQAVPETWKTGQTTKTSRSISTGSTLPSNNMVDIRVLDENIWVGTNKGVGRFTPTAGSSDPIEGTWLSFNQSDGLGRGGVSALVTSFVPGLGSIVAAATIFDTTTGLGDFQAGGGIAISDNNGENWLWMPQPIDSLDETEFEPTVTNIQNTTWDLGFLGNRLWAASWGGGLRYLELSPDMTEEDLVWVNQPPDTNDFNVQANLNHLAFSIAVMDTLLWVGSAGGINLSNDNGETWQHFTHSSTNEATVSGNWAPAMAAQITTSGKHVLWAATRSTQNSGSDATQFNGVSKSEDFGATWQRVLGGINEPVLVNNFAFDDSVVFAASNDGLYKSTDFGETWGLFPDIYDPISGERTYRPEVYGALFALDRLWRGGPEGLAVSPDYGNSWRIIRTYPVPGEGSTPDAYAYPVPFSPNRYPALRFQYEMDNSGKVSLEIYDFAMELVVRPVKNEWRTAGPHTEAWDGKGPGGSEIANGVYFFRIAGGGEERWGKLLILD